MNIILIIFAWIIIISMLYQLYKIRKELENNKKNNKRQNIIYVLIVILLALFILWGIQRN